MCKYIKKLKTMSNSIVIPFQEVLIVVSKFFKDFSVHTLCWLESCCEEEVE